MISIVLSNLSSDKLNALTNVSWIRPMNGSNVDNPTSAAPMCDVIIAENILDIDPSIIQVIFSDDETIASSSTTIYISANIKIV